MKYLKATHVIFVYIYFILALWLAFSFTQITIAFYRIMINVQVAQAEALRILAGSIRGT